MKKITIFILLAIQLQMNAQNPTFEWAKNFGTTESQATSNIVDPSGNTYTAGKFQGTGDFDSSANTFSLTSINQFDLYITKYDSSGNFIWAKSFGSALPTDTPINLALDVSGNVYATGSFRATSDFNPGPAVMNLTSVLFLGTYYNSTFILKLDTNGNYIWAKNILGGAGNQGAAIKIDNNGDVVIGGMCSAFTDLDPGAGTAIISSSGNYIYILKLNSSGEYVWSKNCEVAVRTKTYSISIDTNNAIIATGVFTQTMDFDPGAGVFELTSNNADDIFITKLDSSGNFIWAKSIGGTDNDIVNGMTLDNNNNICLTGNFWGIVDFDTSVNTFNLTATSTTGISKDGFILKLNSAGDLVWAKQIGAINTIEEDSRAIAVDNLGNVYTTGYLQDINLLGNDYDPGAGVFTLFSTIPGDAYFLKLDASGNFVWAFNYRNTSDSGRRQAKTINVSTSGVIYSAGSFRCPSFNAPQDFDFSAGTSLLSCSSTSFLLKFNQTGPLGIPQNDLSKISLYPNPVLNNLTLSFSTLIENGTLRIISLTSQTVFEKQNISGTDFDYDVSNLKSGLYVIQITDYNSTFNSKFIKQ